MARFVKASVFHSVNSAPSAKGGSNPALGMLYRSSSNGKVMLHIHMNAGRRGSVKGPLPDIRPRSVPALEVLSRAASSVGVYSIVPTVPTQGAIPEEGK